MKKTKLIIFVPGYNVSKTIGNVILSLKKIREKIDFDILYIDNDSADNSVNIVKNQNLPKLKIIQNKKNLGYGGSQKVAFRYAFDKKYNYLIEYDGDMQYPAEKILSLYRKIKTRKYSIVFGSRVTNPINIKQMPLWKKIGNKITNLMHEFAFKFHVSEIHTGFRAYNLNLIKGFNLDNCHEDYRWTLDSVIEIQKINSNFSEVPVKALYHEHASSPSFKSLIKVISYMVFRSIKRLIQFD